MKMVCYSSIQHNGLLDGMEMNDNSGIITYSSNEAIPVDSNNLYIGTDSIKITLNNDEIGEYMWNIFPIFFNGVKEFYIYSKLNNKFEEEIFLGKINLCMCKIQLLYVYITLTTSFSLYKISSFTISIHANSSPSDYDTDEDGLPDGWETMGLENKFLVKRSQQKEWNFIPYDEKPNPLMQDIYIEVDRMMGEGNLPQTSKETLKNRFLAHGINIHFDDGTGLWTREDSGDLYTYTGDEGGGGSVMHHEYIGDGTWGDAHNYNRNKDGIISREEIFYYAIICDKLSATDEVGNTVWKFIAISDDKMDNDGEWGAAFMHEIGHLTHQGGDCNNDRCVFQLNDQNYGGLEFITGRYDYCDSCWINIDPYYAIRNYPLNG